MGISQNECFGPKSAEVIDDLLPVFQPRLLAVPGPSRSFASFDPAGLRMG